MNKTQKNLFIGLIVLIIFVPLGLLASGTAFGEWGSDDLKTEIGYIPQGIHQGEEIWKAPLPDYSIPGQQDDFFHTSIGYYASAIIGMILVTGAILLVGYILVKKDSTHETTKNGNS